MFIFLAPQIIDNFLLPTLTLAKFNLSALGCLDIDIISPTVRLVIYFLSGCIFMTSSTSNPTSVSTSSISVGFFGILMKFLSQFSEIFMILKVNK